MGVNQHCVACKIFSIWRQNCWNLDLFCIPFSLMGAIATGGRRRSSQMCSNSSWRRRSAEQMARMQDMSLLLARALTSMPKASAGSRRVSPGQFISRDLPVFDDTERGSAYLLLSRSRLT